MNIKMIIQIKLITLTFCMLSTCAMDIERNDIDLQRAILEDRYMLACQYSLGQALPRNFVEAQALCEQIAQQCEAPDLAALAKAQLGYMHKMGMTGVINYSRALELYLEVTRSAIEQSLTEHSSYGAYAAALAAHGLGNMCLLGQGMERNYAMALYFFERGQGSNDVFVDSLSRLDQGYMYYYGKGVPKDYERARRLFLEAQADEHLACHAIMHCARMYQMGHGVEKDLDQARILYESVARQNILQYCKVIATIGLAQIKVIKCTDTK